MFSHETPYLFRNTTMKLEYCCDLLDNIVLGDLKWDDPDEEKASHQLRERCERYITAYDSLHGTPVAT